MSLRVRPLVPFRKDKPKTLYYPSNLAIRKSIPSFIMPLASARRPSARKQFDGVAA
ncbi:MAG: hypothetical protein M1404_05110 [Acidobacteria bacterium]|nr:hypothetical protein [Acidobacteriota bacterium]